MLWGAPLLIGEGVYMQLLKICVYMQQMNNLNAHISLTIYKQKIWLFSGPPAADSDDLSAAFVLLMCSSRK